MRPASSPPRIARTVAAFSTTLPPRIAGFGAPAVPAGEDGKRPTAPPIGPEAEEESADLVQQRILLYLQRHGDLGRIDPERRREKIAAGVDELGGVLLEVRARDPDLCPAVGARGRLTDHNQERDPDERVVSSNDKSVNVA